MPKTQNFDKYKLETLIKMAAMTKRIMECKRPNYKESEQRFKMIKDALKKKISKKDFAGVDKKIEAHKKKIIKQLNEPCPGGVCTVQEAEPDEIIDE